MHFFQRSIFFLIFFAYTCQVKDQPLEATQVNQEKMQKAITYGNYDVRLGNYLMTYLVASWIAQNNGLPLLYLPFPYCESFAFHEKEIFYRADFESKFKRLEILRNVADIPNIKNSTLIEINLFHNDPTNPKNFKLPYLNIWYDPNFRAFAKPLLRPSHPVNTIALPKDRLTVLLHIRTGGTVDNREIQLRYPNKFPPLSFYSDALQVLSLIFNDPPIYAYIMTDDLHPEKLFEDYSEELSHMKNIEFDYRRDNSVSDTVIEDFFSIPKFDCIIRGSSTFSIAASLLKDFKATIKAKKTHVENGEVVLDEMEIVIKKKS